MKVSFKKKNEYLYSSHDMNPPGFKMHLHDYYEFLLFEGGKANYIVEDNMYEAQPGDLFVTRPGELHTIVFDSDKRYYRQFVQVSKSFLNDIGLDLFSLIDRNGLGYGNKIDAEKVNAYQIPSYYMGIRKYVERRVPESDIMIKTYIIQMLVSINNIINENQVHEKVTLKELNPKVEQIMRYIDKNVTSELSLEHLSTEFFMNKYYMCHIFKENTGFTIKEYINTRRISKAKRLLAEGKDIMSLCFECGFNDYSTFYKTFRRMTEKSPREFFRQK